MFLAEQLTTFYPDLLDERFVSSFAIYHQRYSTNTFPTWPLAQPFRMLAHNGEINTLRGNVNWMKSHETRMSAEEFGDSCTTSKPIIRPGGSDSAASTRLRGAGPRRRWSRRCQRRRGSATRACRPPCRTCTATAIR
jgi:glutamate synthase domain-containing protein 1